MQVDTDKAETGNQDDFSRNALILVGRGSNCHSASHERHFLRYHFRAPA